MSKNLLLGFASITREAYVDLLYVHKDYQRQGIASTLLKTLEEKAKEWKMKILFIETSITVKPFFEKKAIQ